MSARARRRTVIIPATEFHDGFHKMTIKLPWVCLDCGGPRGNPFKTFSFDGSRRLEVHGWNNPCGHLESYNRVREHFIDATKNKRLVSNGGEQQMRGAA